MKTKEILIASFSIIMTVASIISILKDDRSSGAEKFLSSSPKITVINGVYFDYTTKEDVIKPNVLKLDDTSGDAYINLLWVQSKKLEIDNQPYYAFLFGIKGPINNLEIQVKLYDHKPRLSYMLLNRFAYEMLVNHINGKTQQSADIKGDDLGWEHLDSGSNNIEDEKLLKSIRSSLNGGFYSFQSTKRKAVEDMPSFIIGHGNNNDTKTVRFLLPNEFLIREYKGVGLNYFEMKNEDFKKLLIE